MGIYDRDYERGYGGQGGYGGGGGWQPEGQGGIQLRWPSTTVGWVLLVTIGVFLVELPFGEKVMTPLGVRYDNALVDIFHLDAHWYQHPWRIYGLLTYGLLHDPENFMHIAGNMFVFWMFGRMLEARFGSREFLIFYVVAILAGGIAFSAAHAVSGQPATCVGASAGTTAVVVLCALVYPHQPVRMLFLPFEFPLWMLGAFFVIGDMSGALGGSDANIAFAAHLGGAAFALLYHYQGWRLATWVPIEFSLPTFKRRPKLRVHHAEYEDEDKQESDPLADEVDRILAKIGTSGQDSLTRKERRTLEKASRQAKERRG